LNRTGVPTNCNLARRDLQAAAAHGSVKANRVLGTMYAAGHCVGRDLPLAYRWFAKALREDPNNDGLSQDLQVLWTQMTVEERQIAMGDDLTNSAHLTYWSQIQS
jgi:TPR repeat protein